MPRIKKLLKNYSISIFIRIKLCNFLNKQLNFTWRNIKWNKVN